MTNKEVAEMMTLAERNGLQGFDDFSARGILASREILRNNPTDTLSKSITEHFSNAIASGSWEPTFAIFLLPSDATATDEERNAPKGPMRCGHTCPQCDKEWKHDWPGLGTCELVWKKLCPECEARS